MTQPQYATRGPGGRWYHIPSPPLPEPFEGPSVTTILSKGMPAPALKAWGERLVAETAYDTRDSWQNLDRDAAVDHLKRAPYRTMTSAGNTGTDVHALCESIMRSENLGEWATPYISWLDHFRRWLDEWHVTPIHVEHTVVKTGRGGYAGSFDFIADIDGTRVLGDIKTSKGIYPKTGLQLAAYARADLMLSRNGDTSGPMPDVEQLGVLHLREEGYGWYPVTAPTDALFESFMSVHDVAMFEIEHSKQVLPKRAYEPPRREEVRAALRARVKVIVEEWGKGAELAAGWPHGVPTLKTEGLTSHQLDAIESYLRRMEARHRPPPPVASIDRHRESIDRLEAITDQTVFNIIQKYAVSIGIEGLTGGGLTVDQLDQLDRIIAAVVKVPDPEDRAARIGRATNGRTTSPAELTADDMPAFGRTRKTKTTTTETEAA